jgi:hypothetical protein
VSVEILYLLIASGCCVILAFQDLEVGVPEFPVLICALQASESDDGEILDMALANGRASVVCGSCDGIPPRLQSVCLYSTPSEDRVEVAVSGSAHVCLRALAKTPDGDGGIRRLLSDGYPAMALSSLLMRLLHAHALPILIDAAGANGDLRVDDGRPLYRQPA